MVGVSSDSVDSHDAWATTECLPFPLLADANGELRELYGVPRAFLGLLPGRLTFVIRRNGVIHAIEGHQVRLRHHVARARRAVESLHEPIPALVES